MSGQKRDAEDGFTLIELLVVVIIIGILAAIAIPVFLNQREKAYRRSVEADARNAGIAIESYFVDELAYPDPVDQALPWTGAIVFDVVTGGGVVQANVVVSQGVSLDYRLGPAGGVYCVQGDHDQLDGDGDGNPLGDVDVVYDSSAGGIQARGVACSF